MNQITEQKKYKPCCGKRCLLGDCEIRAQGGCYCLCRLFDYLQKYQNTVDGKAIWCEGGYVFFGDTEKIKNMVSCFDAWKKKDYEEDIALAHQRIKEIEAMIVEYMIK